MAVNSVNDLAKLEQGITDELSSLIGDMNVFLAEFSRNAYSFEHGRTNEDTDPLLVSQKSIELANKGNKIIQKMSSLMDTLQAEASNYLYENQESEIDEGEQK